VRARLLTRHFLVPSSAVFLVSAAIIGLELALMRCLSVATWHHFAYLVLSTALLGFGASGTLLCFVGRFLKRRFGLWSIALTLSFALSVPLCFRGAQALPLDPQYLLFSSRQIFVLILYHLLLFVPFLLGATVIGLALVHFRERVHGIVRGEPARKWNRRGVDAPSHVCVARDEAALRHLEG